jgi:hypothetical protein
MSWHDDGVRPEGGYGTYYFSTQGCSRGSTADGAANLVVPNVAMFTVV